MRDLRRSAWRVLAATLCAAWIGHPALGVVIDTGDGSGNTSAPPDDPGWANVGAVNGLTGVYLGNGWVLTASHVGDGAIVLQGITYQPVAGSKVGFEKPPGSHADLIVYRIESPPPLPALVLSDTTPGLGNQVTMIGNSWSRQAGLTYWDADWVEVSEPDAVFAGYKRLCCTNPRRWGRNLVTAIDLDIAIAGATTRSFETVFDPSGGVTYEAQAVAGDSGGAVFVKRAGQWQLAGILFAAGSFTGQPVNTAIFGQTSLAADVAFYHDEIVAVITAPIVPALPPLALITLAGALVVLGLHRLSPPR